MKALLRKRHTRRGLTLIELVIVLAILAALAGLVLPLAGTYLEKAHASSAASNFKEVSKVVQQYNTTQRLFPDGLDSLLSASGVVYADVPAVDVLTVDTLSAGEVDALTAVGITTTYLHDQPAPGNSATFDSTSGALALGGGTNDVVLANATDITEALGYTTDADTTSKLVVFGFGHLTNIIGSWIQEAPYHFPEEGNPNTSYNRFGLVFDVKDESEAKFVGVVTFHEGEIVGPGEPIEEFFGG